MIPINGEIVYDKTNNVLKIGDGVTELANLTQINALPSNMVIDELVFTLSDGNTITKKVLILNDLFKIDFKTDTSTEIRYSYKSRDMYKKFHEYIGDASLIMSVLPILDTNRNVDYYEYSIYSESESNVKLGDSFYLYYPDQLTILDLSRCYDAFYNLNDIKYMTKLKQLSLYGYVSGSNGTAEYPLGCDLSIFSNLINLQSLTLNGFTKITGDISSLSNLSSLRTLNILNCTSITGDASTFNPESLESFTFTGSTGITGTWTAPNS